MNKSELIKTLAKVTDLPVRKSEEITVRKALINGDRIEIRGSASSR